MDTYVFNIHIDFHCKVLPKYTQTENVGALHCISTNQHWFRTKVFDRVILFIEGHQTIYFPGGQVIMTKMSQL